jgi:putative phosphoesterase
VTIAVVSDIHDNVWNLEKALDQIRGFSPERLFFLGDFCAPFTLAQLAEGFPGPIDVVFGNNDGDTFLISRVAAGHPHVTLHGQLAELSVDGKRVALNHYPDIAKGLAASGLYDAVFSGHDHTRALNHEGSTLWANPGEVMGRFGSPSFGIWDTVTGEFQHVDI